MSNHHLISPHSGTAGTDAEELYKYAQSELEKWKQKSSKKKGTTKQGTSRFNQVSGLDLLWFLYYCIQSKLAKEVGLDEKSQIGLYIQTYGT